MRAVPEETPHVERRQALRDAWLADLVPGANDRSYPRIIAKNNEIVAQGNDAVDGPDFLPFIGYADDAIIVALVLRGVARRRSRGDLKALT